MLLVFVLDTTISIDDCWEYPDGPRLAGAALEGDPRRFPKGMKAVGDYLHSKVSPAPPASMNLPLIANAMQCSSLASAGGEFWNLFR